MSLIPLLFRLFPFPIDESFSPGFVSGARRHSSYTDTLFPEEVNEAGNQRPQGARRSGTLLIYFSWLVEHSCFYENDSDYIIFIIKLFR